RPGCRPRAEDLAGWWADLADEDAAAAYRAAANLAAAGPDGCAFLARRIAADPGRGPGKARAWLAAPGGGHFYTREAAAWELAQCGAEARPLLEKALTGRPSLEARARLGRLLTALTDRTFSPYHLQRYRAITVLEHADSPDAEDALRALVDANPDGLLG